MDILKSIEAFDVVTIFRHQIADQDALGSQFGLKSFLEQYCPDKKIYALGHSVGSMARLFPPIDDVDDHTIANSVAIILDTADSARIDDQRYQLAKKRIKIDHHIVVEEYAEEAYVDISAAATCEILASLFQKYAGRINVACAQYLYYGLTADSLSFTTTNTTSQTLLSAAYLIDNGVNVSEINQSTADMSVNDFHYINEIRNNVQIQGKVAYSMMKADTYQKYGLTYNQAKEKVFALANVDQFEIWCLFTEDLEYGIDIYNGSLRSKKVAINEIAARYRGGGHKNACGVKQLSIADIASIVDEFDHITK